jgi:hypothetical protein
MRLIVRRLSNLCYDGRRTYEHKDTAMRQRYPQNNKSGAATAAPQQPQSPASEARLAAVVEAAYLLEARTR